MKFKDIEIFWKSFLHSRNNGFSKDSCWWDYSNQKDLEKIVDQLSNTNTSEREIIQKKLIENGICSVLDAGCGVGTEFERYKAGNMNLKYVGMEKSNRMLKIAKTKHPEAIFIYGDINQMQFKDNSFDAVVLKHVLEHLPYYDKAVSEAVRVSSKLVVIDFFHKLWFFDYLNQHKSGFYENWYSKRKFLKFINKLPISGYEVINTVGTSRQTAEIYLLHKK